MSNLVKRIKDAWMVLTGQTSVLSDEIIQLITEIYSLTDNKNMDANVKEKLDAVKAYLVGLPDKFKKLQDQIDALKGDDDADKAKIADLTSQVDTLKVEHDEISAVADELDAAAKASDAADGDETPPVEPTP